MAEYIDKEITLDALESKKKETEKLVLEDTHSIIKDSNRCGRLSGICDSQRIVYDIPPADVIPIPKGATNGDMIKALFDVEIVDEFAFSYGVKLSNSNYAQFNKDWWNAPYKKEVEE